MVNNIVEQMNKDLAATKAKTNKSYDALPDSVKQDMLKAKEVKVDQLVNHGMSSHSDTNPPLKRSSSMPNMKVEEVKGLVYHDAVAPKEIETAKAPSPRTVVHEHEVKKNSNTPDKQQEATLGTQGVYKGKSLQEIQEMRKTWEKTEGQANNSALPNNKGHGNNSHGL